MDLWYLTTEATVVCRKASGTEWRGRQSTIHVSRWGCCSSSCRALRPVPSSRSQPSNWRGGFDMGSLKTVHSSVPL
eukprot:365826-Chlamydomonas_euryale.AAC.3